MGIYGGNDFVQRCVFKRTQNALIREAHRQISTSPFNRLRGAEKILLDRGVKDLCCYSQNAERSAYDEVCCAWYNICFYKAGHNPPNNGVLYPIHTYCAIVIPE